VRGACIFGLLLGLAAAAGYARAADSDLDKSHFDEWLAPGAKQTLLKWTSRTLATELSVHQRLVARLQVQLDGAEAAKRRGEGQLVFFFRLTDAQGHVYQDHSEYDLEKVEVGIKASDLLCTDTAFVLPGDYQVAYAILDTATGEHAVRRDKLHVAALRIDPLPQAWRDLPQVEFIPAKERPENWFLAEILGKLNLPVALRRPLRVDVLMNLTPAERLMGAYGMQDRNLSVLFPALKTISAVSAEKMTLNVQLLDLSRRRVAFHQEDVKTLDWERIKNSLTEPTSGSIDVGSLAKRSRNAAFFAGQVRKSFRPGEACAVIVLSAAMDFDTPQDLEGVDLTPSPDCKVFYIRYQVAIPGARADNPMLRGRRRGSVFSPARGGVGMQPIELPAPQVFDQLEPVLKPLDPRLFDVTTPEDFRRALASVLTGLAGL
jgi:hypothetical protein